MKTCSKCKIEKNTDEFHKDKNRKDGLDYRCKVCKKKHADEYTKTEDSKKSRKKWQQDNMDRVKVSQKKYYKKNRDKILEKNREWAQNNKESCVERSLRWQKKNKDKVAEYKRRRRAAKNNVKENYTPAQEKITREIFNNKCFNCGCKEGLCIDHYYPLSKGNALTLLNACVLCQSCNCSKNDKNPLDFFGLKKHVAASIYMLIANTVESENY